MKIITLINQKGGTGKTTVTMNLGVALVSLGKKILLIDLDPQANLTYSFGIQNPKNTIDEVKKQNNLIYNCFTRETKNILKAFERI